MRRPKRKVFLKKERKTKRDAYNIPNQEDLDNLQAKIDKLSKNLNEEGYRVDKKGNIKPFSEKEVLSLLRSSLRKYWMSCNLKLSFLNKGKVPDYDPESRRLFKIQCSCCKQWFKEGDIQIDHIAGGLELTSLDRNHVMVYVNQLLNIGYKDIDRLCIDCHAIKTRSEVSGVTVEQAKILIDKKELIESASKEWLVEKGVVPEKAVAKRKQQIIDILFGEL